MSPAAAPPRVQILDISCVTPLHATKRFNLFLPFADTVLKGTDYIRTIFFYSLDTHDAAAFTLEALKHGLSLALVPFYPVAGRLHDDESGQLTIDCNDKGVEFVEAVIDCAFADLEEQSFPIHDFYDALARFSPAIQHPHDPSLLSIQVTRFQGGRGIAIGVAASHVVFDGYSLFYFLKSWGQCCRGQGVSLPPLHIRTLMSSEFWGMDKLSKKSFVKNDICLPLPPPSANVHHKIMHFDSTTAQQLKRTAIEESGNVRISTFQAVMACVWKRNTAARNLPPHQKGKTRGKGPALSHKACDIYEIRYIPTLCIHTYILNMGTNYTHTQRGRVVVLVEVKWVWLCWQMRLRVPANVRNKTMPSLTDAYVGNALVSIGVQTTAGELQRESVGAIAAKINESLKVLEDGEYVRERMATREEELREFYEEMRRGGGEQILVISLGSKLPMFDVDVGMGKPLALRPAYMPNDVHVCVYSGREHGSISVSLRFSTLQTLQAFLSIPSPCIDI